MKVFKQGSQIDIKFGLAFIQRIQQLNFWFAEGKTEEQLQALQDWLSGKTETGEDWMYHYQTALVLLQTIEQTADQQGLLEDRPDEDILGPVDEQ